MPEKITRTFAVQLDPEQRDGAPRTLRGKFVPFNSTSLDIGFRETFNSGSLRFAQRVDVNLFHDRTKLVASTANGTLRVWQEPDGGYFEATPSDSTAGRDAMAYARDGLVTQASVEFEVLDDDWERRDGEEHHIVKSALVSGFGLTPIPAYTETSVSARSRTGRIDVGRTRSPYGPDSEHSWYRDRAKEQARDDRMRMTIDGAFGMVASMNATYERTYAGPPIHGLEEARERLAIARDEYARTVEARDVVASSLGTPVGAPAAVIATWSAACRARANLLQLLEAHDLPPEAGMTIDVPNLGTATAATSPTAELQNITEIDTPASTPTISAPVGFLAGFTDSSIQAIDLSSSGGRFDQVTTQDLVEALLAEAERQAFHGTASNQQMRGLINVSGITAVTVATATTAAIYTSIGQATSGLATALGREPDTVLMHPRRLRWLQATATLPIRDVFPDVRIVTSTAISTALGGGTEDAIFVISSPEVHYWRRMPEIHVDRETLSQSGGVRINAHQFAGIVGNRRNGKAVAKITGAGLAAPAGY